MMQSIVRLLLYGGFAASIAYLSAAPGYRLLGESEAMLSLSFSHAAERVEACRRLSQEELQDLPPNMRKPDDCPRERHSIRVELRIDGEVMHRVTAAPSGLWRDGKANVYRRMRVGAGAHDIYVGMNDSGGDSTMDYELDRRLSIEPGRNIVISFDDAAGTFVIE